MEHLFSYTKKLIADIFSLLEDISALQNFSNQQKKAISAEEKVKDLVSKLQKKVYFLRILMHISYLEEYKGDFARALSEIDSAITSPTISKIALKKISIFLDAIGRIYQMEEEIEQKALAPISLSAKVIDKLELTMKAVEEILLSQYGLTNPVTNLEEKLVHSIEALFHLPLDELTQKEKELIEAFFNHIHDAFDKKEAIHWEDAFIKCTAIMNTLKEDAGLPQDSTLEISIDPPEEDVE
ncbi:hypothetical protein K0U07_00870 [bacterium]|nr:hypothetical protein [bacterium]